MNAININLKNPINISQMEYLFDAIKIHLDFYCDNTPELLRITGDSLQIKLNSILSEDDQELIRESIEIDIPEVQVSFTQNF